MRPELRRQFYARLVFVAISFPVSDKLAVLPDQPVRPNRHPNAVPEEAGLMKALKIVGIVVVLLVVALIALPFLVDVNAFRSTIEADLTTALGRQVKIGNLKLSIFSGSLSADDLSIADDPAFNKNAFIQAKGL